jgi:hypothetical protein
MRFEARELKPYAEPITDDELQEGKAYFQINYTDEEMLHPIMETLVFIGRNLEKNDSNHLYFQDIDSYSAGRRYENESERDSLDIWGYEVGQTNHIFDFEHALEQLMLCSLRRASAGL